MAKGAFFSANDRVYSWTLALLRSFRKYNPELPLYWIPFNEDSGRIKELSYEFGFQTYQDPSFLELEALGEAYELGHSPYGKYWFRRYAAFWGPLDEFIYLDARKVVLDDLSPIFGLLRNFDFLYMDQAPDQVYEPGALRNKFIEERGARAFLSGFWASKKGIFTKEEMLEIGYSSMRQRHQLNPRNTDQAFINYCVDSKRLKTGQLAELLGGYTGQCWAGQRGRVYQNKEHYYLWDYGGLDHKKKVLLLHWAGYGWNDKLPQNHVIDRFSKPSLKTRLKRVFAGMRRMLKSSYWLRKWMGDV